MQHSRFAKELHPEMVIPAWSGPGGEGQFMHLLERRFRVKVSVERAWAHLERVERWPSWARHIRRAELRPPGVLVPESAGTCSAGGVPDLVRSETPSLFKQSTYGQRRW